MPVIAKPLAWFRPSDGLIAIVRSKLRDDLSAYRVLAGDEAPPPDEAAALTSDTIVREVVTVKVLELVGTLLLLARRQETGELLLASNGIPEPEFVRQMQLHLPVPAARRDDAAKLLCRDLAKSLQDHERAIAYRMGHILSRNCRIVVRAAI